MRNLNIEKVFVCIANVASVIGCGVSIWALLTVKEVQPVVIELQSKIDTLILSRKDTLVIFRRDSVFVPKYIPGKPDLPFDEYLEKAKVDFENFVKRNRQDFDHFVAERKNDFDNHKNQKQLEFENYFKQSNDAFKEFLKGVAII